MQIEWICTGKDKYGETLMISLTGPMSAEEARHHANVHHFGAMRRNAVNAGAEDPELIALDGDAGVYRKGEHNNQFGQFKPAGVKPLDLDKYVPKGKKPGEQSTDDIEL